jgi:hypothetical protein
MIPTLIIGLALTWGAQIVRAALLAFPLKK